MSGIRISTFNYNAMRIHIKLLPNYIMQNVTHFITPKELLQIITRTLKANDINLRSSHI